MKSDYPHKRILLYQHLIYDLTDLTHPGGDIIFTEYNFKEISRYVLGTHSSESLSFPAFKHSQAAHVLLKQNLIGSLIGKQIDITDPNQNSNWEFDRMRDVSISPDPEMSLNGESYYTTTLLSYQDDAIHIDDNWTLYDT